MTARRLLTPLALVMLVFALIVGMAPGVAAATNYTCPRTACRFTVPDSYVELSAENLNLTLRDELSGGVFAVLLQDAPSGASLADLTDASVREFATRGGYVADAQGVRDETINGLRGKSFTFASNNSSGTLVIAKVYFFINGDVFYTLYFAATPDTIDAFVGSANDILASFQFS